MVHELVVNLVLEFRIRGAEGAFDHVLRERMAISGAEVGVSWAVGWSSACCAASRQGPCERPAEPIHKRWTEWVAALYDLLP